MFTLTRTGSASEELVVTIAVEGGGGVLTDDPPTEATFRAGAATTQVRLATEDDAAHEANATLTLTVLDGDAYYPGEPNEAGITVEDNDDSPASGSVTITPVTTFTEGERLSAATSGITDEDGLGDAVYAYQWVRTLSGGGDEDISDKTDAAYEPVFADTEDAGARLKVRVTVTDDEGHKATFESAPISVTALPRPVVRVVSDGDVTEGSPAVFTLTLTGDTAEELEVAYKVAATGSSASPRARPRRPAWRRTPRCRCR